jgi:hypothetical protein
MATATEWGVPRLSFGSSRCDFPVEKYLRFLFPSLNLLGSSKSVKSCLLFFFFFFLFLSLCSSLEKCDVSQLNFLALAETMKTSGLDDFANKVTQTKDYFSKLEYQFLVLQTKQSLLENLMQPKESWITNGETSSMLLPLLLLLFPNSEQKKKKSPTCPKKSLKSKASKPTLNKPRKKSKILLKRCWKVRGYSLKFALFFFFLALMLGLFCLPFAEFEEFKAKQEDIQQELSEVKKMFPADDSVSVSVTVDKDPLAKKVDSL